MMALPIKYIEDMSTAEILRIKVIREYARHTFLSAKMIYKYNQILTRMSISQLEHELKMLSIKGKTENTPNADATVGQKLTYSEKQAQSTSEIRGIKTDQSVSEICDRLDNLFREG